MKGTTPRLGALQWVGPGLVGMAALVVAVIQSPLFGSWPDDGSGRLSAFSWIYFSPLFMLVYTPFVVAIGASLVGAFRALAAAPHRQEFHALIALGASRRGLRFAQLRSGLAHGAVFAGGATILGAAYRQITAGGMGEFNSNTAWTLLISAGAGVFTVLIAYVSVAHWLIGRTKRTSPTRSKRKRGGAVADGGPSDLRQPRLVWPWIAIGVLIASPLLNRLWEASGYQFVGGSERPWWARLTVAIAVTFTAGTWFALPALLMLAGARAARVLGKVSGRALAAGSHGTGWRAITADGLLRPTPVRAIATVAIGTVMAASTAITMGSNAADARIELASDLTPEAIVSTFAMDLAPLAPRDIAPPALDGVVAAPDPLPGSLVASMQADPDLIVVPAGVIVADPGTAWGDSRKPFAVMALSARALDAVSPGAVEHLYLAPGYAWGYATTITVGGQEVAMDAPFAPAPVIGVSREWAEDRLGPVPTSGLLLYPAGEETVDDVLAGYDLAGLKITHTMPSEWESEAVRPATLARIAGPLLLLATGLVIALAFTVQRLRARDYATMSALGATRRALRGATAAEAAATTLIGATVGTLFGVALGAYSTLTTAHLGLTDVDALALQNIGFDIVHAPWLTLWGLTLAATSLAAVGSLLARAQIDDSSPVEQLREAVKAGSS